MVLNSFGGEEHLKLATVLFQNLFPAINVHTTSLKSCKVCLHSYWPCWAVTWPPHTFKVGIASSHQHAYNQPEVLQGVFALLLGYNAAFTHFQRWYCIQLCMPWKPHFSTAYNCNCPCQRLTAGQLCPLSMSLFSYRKTAQRTHFWQYCISALCIGFSRYMIQRQSPAVVPAWNVAVQLRLYRSVPNCNSSAS